MRCYFGWNDGCTQECIAIVSSTKKWYLCCRKDAPRHLVPTGVVSWVHKLLDLALKFQTSKFDEH